MPQKTSERSRAFKEFLQGAREVALLRRSVPPATQQMRSHRKRDLANALHRSSVVLLSSHLQRYCESLVMESIEAINHNPPLVDAIPEALRFTQIKQALQQVCDTQKPLKKRNAVSSFIQDYAWFWDNTHTCKRLRAGPLIDTFGNPKTKPINELFSCFGISDAIQCAIDKDTHPREDAWRIRAKVDELVEKRHTIAHTGMTTDLTTDDIADYLHYTYRLVACIDEVIGQKIQKITGDWPWQ